MNWASLQGRRVSTKHKKQQRQMLLITPGEEWFANPLQSSAVNKYLAWQAGCKETADRC
jgi:hypothetical protein